MEVSSKQNYFHFSRKLTISEAGCKQCAKCAFCSDFGGHFFRGMCNTARLTDVKEQQGAKKKINSSRASRNTLEVLRLRANGRTPTIHFTLASATPQSSSSRTALFRVGPTTYPLLYPSLTHSLHRSETGRRWRPTAGHTFVLSEHSNSSGVRLPALWPPVIWLRLLEPEPASVGQLTSQSAKQPASRTVRVR